MPNSCIRLFIIAAVLWFSFPLLAADRNFTEYEESSYYNACERLLEADLSGYFVATKLDPEHKHSQVIQLRRLGTTSAYTVNVATMELASTGIRELQFNRGSEGWLIGDPASPGKRVNILTIDRAGGEIGFKFEDANDPLGVAYTGQPVEESGAIQGDILNPDQWIVDFEGLFSGEVQFTRIKLDKAFEQVVSQSLKSLLATRLDPGEAGVADFIITVETKKPLTIDEAEDILGAATVYPLDEVAGSNVPFYRFAVPINIYELLEYVGHWTRRWEVSHIDAVPARLINPEIVRAIVNRVRAVAQQGGFKSAMTQVSAPSAAPPPASTPARTLNSLEREPVRSPFVSPATQEPESLSDALTHLQKLATDAPRNSSDHDLDEEPNSNNRNER
ncbi:MAG: hypothetical protein ACXVA9_09835 [Bdellovibrionales bacterium]